jgi:histidinol phosphatase-like PHP family hydrolase
MFNIEITTKKGHNVSNKEVVKVAIDKGARLLLNTNTHIPECFLTRELIIKTLLNVGLLIGLL